MIRRPLAAALVGFGIAAFTVTGVASAHANSIVCIDQATSTFRITNDYPLAESFTSPQGPSGNVAAGNGSYTDVVYVGDSLQIDAVWSDGYSESRTGTGDCTPEGGTTTTVAETTTTSEVTTSSTTTTSPATTAPTTVPEESTTTAPSTTMLETTSTTAVSTSTTSPSEVTSTTAPSQTSSVPDSTTSTLPVVVTTSPAECSDNPNTPQNDCAPILPPTGFIGGTLLIIAGCLIGVGLLIGLVLRRKS